MPLTKCNRCHRTDTTVVVGSNCLITTPFEDAPCMGTMRRADVPSALRIWHLVKHMRVWELHRLKLESIYVRDQNLPCLREVRDDRKKLTQWRERLDAIDPRRNRKDGVPVLQGDDGSQVQEPKRQSINDPPIQ